MTGVDVFDGRFSVARGCRTESAKRYRAGASDSGPWRNGSELAVFTDEVIAEMTGFGPIEPLLKDPTVSDILINTHELCFVERFGKLERTNVRFKDEAHLLRIINKISSQA
jgi:Flp pilus assembly CpaF family ATPase